VAGVVPVGVRAFVIVVGPRAMNRAIEAISLVAVSCGLACSSGQKIPTPPPPDPPPDSVGNTAIVAPPPTKPTTASTLDAQGLSLAALDRSADPCDDFYRYACGGWEKATAIPDDRSRWSRSFSEIDQRNEADLRKILEDAAKAPAPKKGNAKPAHKIGSFYASCMDTGSIEKAKTKPLAPLLESVNAVKDRASLTKALVALHRRGIWALFNVDSGQDYKDATKMIGMLDQAGLGLPDRDYYLKDDADKKDIRAKYSEHVSKMLVLSGMDKKAADAATVHVLAMETEIARVSKSKEDRREPAKMYNKVDRGGLVKATPQIDWDAYFKGLAFPDIVDISVTSPDFFAGVDALLQKASPDAVRAYLRWQVVHQAAPHLTKALEEEDFAMSAAITGQKVQRERWKRCIDATDEALGELLAQPFIEQRFGGDSKQGAELLVSAIAKAMGARLDELEWMDPKTRELAREKLTSMAYLIGYPAKWKEYDFGVTASHFDNVSAGAIFRVRQNLKKVGKPVDRGEWYMTPPTVNAYYDPQKNQMVFPAGILQPPFFSAKASVPVNLGAMGMVVGHELTHGFDDEGSQFDKAGNLSNWWSQETGAVFKQKGACVEKQYGAYEVLPGLKLNGKLTLGENIADVGGIKLAFRAYRDLRSSAKEEVLADGFREDQQFFLSVGQIWCSKYTEKATRLLAQVDPHSHPRFRVNGPLSQLPEFAAAFKCQSESRMAPKERCSVW